MTCLFGKLSFVPCHDEMESPMSWKRKGDKIKGGHEIQIPRIKEKNLEYLIYYGENFINNRHDIFPLSLNLDIERLRLYNDFSHK